MAHTAHSTMKDLINDIKAEDHTAYLDLINTVNTDKLEGYQIQPLLMGGNSNIMDKLTDNQIELLKCMTYARGSDIYAYSSYGKPDTRAIKRWGSIITNINTAWRSIDTDFSKDDFKFVSLYTQTKWKQAHPSQITRNAKGTQYNFNIDEFSLNIFKRNIKKGFLRTEAKNYVLKVNSAFSKTNGDEQAIRIRNKFYAVILDNTEVHTKAMLNSLQPTALEKYDYNTRKVVSHYNAHPDEALVIELGGKNKALRSVNNSEAHESYSTDTNICTHMKPINDPRVQRRIVAAASCMTTLASKLNSDTYNNLAAKMVSTLDQDLLTEAQELTESAATLNKIIKEIK